MKPPIDKLDLRILSFLQTDGRITNQALADKVGLSPSSCLQRVKRLEQQGYISQYLSQINLAKVCRYVTCIATVKMRNHTPQDFDDFAALVATVHEIIECSTVSGECDFILKIVCRDMSRHLELNNFLLNSSKKIESINTHVVMKENKQFSSFPLKTLIEN